MSPTMKYHIAVLLGVAVLAASVAASVPTTAPQYPSLPISVGSTLTATLYTFTVNQAAGTLVGSFSDSGGFTTVVVTTYTNYSDFHHTPVLSCSGTFNMSLPQGTYYILFGSRVQVTQTIQVVYPALGSPRPPPDWPSWYPANMTAC